MNNYEMATARFQQGFNCSQSVFSTFAEQMGVDRETALKIACAFGGGMGRLGETCGAVTGALMVIGLKYGMINAEDQAAKDKTYAVAREFMRRFNEQYGETTCKALLGVDISTPEGMAQAREQNLFHSICPNYVGDAVAILEEIL
jgi:C_GCAxxG_C_C family probable redox protein